MKARPRIGELCDCEIFSTWFLSRCERYSKPCGLSVGPLAEQVHRYDVQADQDEEAIAATSVVFERITGSKHF